MPLKDNIRRLFFLFSNGSLMVGDSMIKNDIIATIEARNLFTPKYNRILSKRSDELAAQDYLALSVKCVSSISNMGQRLLARTRQVEPLMANAASLKREIRGLKHENREFHICK